MFCQIVDPLLSKVLCTSIRDVQVNALCYLQVAIRALGFEVKKADVLKIMKDCDKEGKGKITFQDFSEISKYVSSVLKVKPIPKGLLLKHCYNYSL